MSKARKYRMPGSKGQLARIERKLIECTRRQMVAVETFKSTGLGRWAYHLRKGQRRRYEKHARQVERWWAKLQAFPAPDWANRYTPRPSLRPDGSSIKCPPVKP